MNWLILSWALTTAYLPVNTQAIYAPTGPSLGLANPGALSAELEQSAEDWGHVRAWGSVETFANFNAQIPRFIPFESVYIVGAALFANGVEAGVKLECSHGIESGPARPWYGAMSTAIYLKLSGRSAP